MPTAPRPDPETLKCPSCGGTSGFEASVAVSGPWITHHEWDGNTIDTMMDQLRFRPFKKRVICLDCGKRVPNPLYGK